MTDGPSFLDDDDRTALVRRERRVLWKELAAFVAVGIVVVVRWRWLS